MRFFLISDNVDTLVGMRLAGIEGVVIHTKDDLEHELNLAINRKDIAVVLITKILVDLDRDMIYSLKLNCKRPLIVEILDRHGAGSIKETISKYINDAIGLKF